MSDFIWVGDKRMSGPMVMERIAELGAEIQRQHDLHDRAEIARKALYDRAEQAEAILLGEDVTVAAYRNMQAALATRTANRDELIEMVRSLKAALDTCRTNRNEWRLRYERVEELRVMYLAEKKQTEAALVERDKEIAVLEMLLRLQKNVRAEEESE